MTQIVKAQSKKKSKTDLQKRYSKLEIYKEDTTHSLTEYYRDIITTLGENATREGLEKTPMRAAKAMQFLTHGYQLDPEAILKSAMFKEQYSEMVIVKDIEMYSMCEHHLLPFFGRAHIAYIPNGYIVGLSKLGRIVDAFSRRLQVQERLTHEILNCIQNTLNPIGVAVVIEAKHLCMMMRGVQKQNSVATTSAFTGEFAQERTRSEFIRLISADLMH
ncbi:MAG: GTP cyclohydrolase I FolE [Chitinophagaceae bacterium]|nr:GTP cyclohydrolase I FolE [Chitinophagaceae bacterium]